MKKLFCLLSLFCILFSSALAENTTRSGLVRHLNEQLESRFRYFPLESEEEQLQLSFNFDSKTVLLYGARSKRAYAWECKDSVKLYDVCLEMLEGWAGLAGKELVILAYFPGDDYITAIRSTGEARDFALRLELAQDSSPLR